MLAAFSTRNGITFPMLSDAGSATIRRYGLVNTVAEEAQRVGDLSTNPGLKADFERLVTATVPSTRYLGVSIPGTFMLDRQGRVTARFVEDYYRERRTTSNLMLTVGQGAQVPGTKVSTAHLDLTSYASDEVVALGNRFSVVLDIAPKRGVHVYAPGASGYKVIALNLAPQPFVRIQPRPYPSSETYFFKPLDERVPAYLKPFRLVMDIVPEATPAAQAAWKGKDTLTLTGTLDYQACDDTLCYNPTSVPVSYTIALKPYVPGEPQPPAR